MYTSKLLTALNTLSKEEWSSFKKYLQKETTDQTDVFLLFEIIYSKKDDLQGLGNTEAFRKKKFDQLSQKGFLNLLSKLYGWLEDWFAINEMMNERFSRDLYLLKSHNRRSLYKNADQIANKLEKSIISQKLNTENSEALKKLYHYQYFSNNPIKSKEGVHILENLAKQHSKNYLDQTFLYLTEMVNFGRIMQYDYNEILKYLKQSISALPNTHFTPILSELLLQIEDLQTANATILYEYLKRDILEKPSELHTLLTLYSIYIATKQRQKGEDGDLHLIYNLYDYAFENEIFTQNGKISSLRFTDLITVISKISTYQESIQLVDKWIEKVETNHSDEIKDLAYSIACLQHHKFEDLLYYARHISFDRVDQKLKAQVHYLIAQYYVSDGDVSLFKILATNFLRSLQRNKKEFSKRTYLGYINFHNFITKLVRQKVKSKNLKIDRYNLIIPRSWMEYEIEQLKQQGYTITLL